MSFVLQRVTPRGLVLNQVSAEVLRIGRGTNAELRSDNPAVSLDHAEFLGDTVAKIAAEKAGILKRGRPAVSGVRDPDARRSIERIGRASCRERV